MSQRHTYIIITNISNVVPGMNVVVLLAKWLFFTKALCYFHIKKCILIYILSIFAYHTIQINRFFFVFLKSECLDMVSDIKDPSYYFLISLLRDLSKDPVESLVQGHDGM